MKLSSDGTFHFKLFSPVLGTALLGVFRADKTGTSLSRRVHEIVVLTVGAAWRSDYELYAHRAVARVAGLPDSVIRALTSGQPPALESEEEAIAYAFTWQLAHRHRVDQDTYAHASRALGDKGVVDMVMLIGLYFTTCAIINAFEIPMPEGETWLPTVDTPDLRDQSS